MICQTDCLRGLSCIIHTADGSRRDKIHNDYQDNRKDHHYRHCHHNILVRIRDDNHHNRDNNNKNGTHSNSSPRPAKKIKVTGAENDRKILERIAHKKAEAMRRVVPSLKALI
ncbi:hypothetical protein BGZ47_004110 [Haplosporangium gracile]|nr:hypothetical protein BGZ47_004110 [Haplosporangium gracile]